MDTRRDEIEIRVYLSFIRKWLWLALLCMVVAALSTYLLSQQVPKRYRATATLLISQGRVNDPTGDLAASERLARTYTELLASLPLLEETKKRLDLPESMITIDDIAVQFVQGTQLIRVSVDHAIPEVAQQVANMIPQVFSEQNQEQQSARYTDSKSNLKAQLDSIQEEIGTTEALLEKERDATRRETDQIRGLEEQLTQLRSTYASLLQSYEQVRLTEATYQNTIVISVPATLPKEPVWPQPLQWTLIAALVGLVIGMGAGWLIDSLDDTVKPSSNLGQLVGVEPLALIGHIGQLEKEGEQVLVTSLPHRAPATEAYRMLRTNLRFASVSASERLQTLLVTSSGPSEGKSTTAANLALVTAQAGQRVILVDADLRRPVQHKIFNINHKTGLTTALVERETSVLDYLQETSIEHLRLLPAGVLPPNPSELLGSERMKELLKELEKHADLVIIDSPPILAVADSSLLATFVSGVILILRAKRTRLEATKLALKQLHSTQAQVLGLVINDVQASRQGYYYYYSTYYSEQ